MQAAIAALFRVFDVVLRLNDVDVILHGQHVRQFVNIVHKRADDANARDIVQILFNRVHRNRQAEAVHLFINASRLFETRFNALNRVAVEFVGEFDVQHLKLGFHFEHRAGIIAHQPQILAPLRLQFHK